MAKLISTIAILLVVLPALIAASACRIAISSRITESENRYNVYQATLTNVGSATAANVAISSSVDLRDISGMKESDDSYTLPKSQVNNGGIAVRGTYSFTYSVSKGKTVQWTVSCTDAAGSATTAPTAPTSAPTARQATAAPTVKAATQAPTTKPSTSGSATTKPATQAATAKAATTKPSTGGNGKLCPAGTVWSPAPQTTWQWQLTGTVDTSVNVQMFDIDLEDATASLIATLHSKGKAVICYFSTQYENWRSDARSFPTAAIGKPLDGWAGENWVDIRNAGLRQVMTARLDMAVSKGCDGVEPDNVDTYTQDSGFPLTANDQLNYNRFLASEAHARGLSVGLKNDLDQATALQPNFDWALNEECNHYSECSMLTVFVNAGKAVFNTEYSGTAASVCPKMVTQKFSSLLKGLDLDASIKAQCCTYQPNGCAVVPHTCKAVSKRGEVEESNNVYAAQALETLELTQEAPKATNSATSSFASIAFVVVAAVAAMNL